MAYSGDQPWQITAIKVVDDSKLQVSFVTGERKLYNVRPLMEFPIFAPLLNREFFRTAELKNGSVCWGDDLDIAPEELYSASVPIV